MTDTRQQRHIERTMNPWWASAAFYQVYPLSFADSTGNGFGDIQGVIEHLDYLSETLDVDAVWMSPFYRSPMRDWGYDVSDHTDVDPRFGTLHDVQRLIDGAHDRGMKIIVDYVINHTSSEHLWFADSRSSRTSPKRDWYVWRDPDADGGPPNNWVSVFSGPSWTFDKHTGQYYRHTYLPHQPDLNWRNPEVVDAMEQVARFWLERGVDGFRVDAAHQMMKDPLERDNPRVPDDYVDPYKDLGEYGRFDHRYDLGHEDIHACHRRLRTVLDEYHDRVAIGEVHIFDLVEWARYYGSSLDELHMPFNFQLMIADWEADEVRSTVESVLAAIPQDAATNWTMGNHDEPRVVSRLGADHARLAAMLLLTLPGAAFLYYGDEIGMRQGTITDKAARDPWGNNVEYLGRDGCRTPMQWTSEPGAGFTHGEPWLPVNTDHDILNVEDQINNPASMLTLYRDLLSLRRQSPALRNGTYRTLPVDIDGVYAYERGSQADMLTVVLNFSDSEVAFPFDGSVRCATNPEGYRNGTLGPRSGVVLVGPNGAI